MLELEAFGLGWLEASKVTLYHARLKDIWVVCMIQDYMIQDYMCTLFYGFFLEMCYGILMLPERWNRNRIGI